MLGGSMIIRCKDLRQIKLDFYDCNDFINVADSLEKLCAIGMDNDKNYSALRYDDFKLFSKLFLDVRRIKMTVVQTTLKIKSFLIAQCSDRNKIRLHLITYFQRIILSKLYDDGFFLTE